jgi:putative sigma-54 modulation protein
MYDRRRRCFRQLDGNAKKRKGVESMRYIISGKNIDVTEGLRTAITDKLGKLERYFTPDTEVQVTLSVEKERQKIEVTIPVKGTVIRSEQVSNDMYVSIDLVEEVIERQLRKYKNKIVQREQGGGSFRQEFIDKEAEDEEVRIIRTKQYDLKPMYPEDACVQMEMLGHSFYVFVNAETDQVNVVYKRKGNTYGLLEPEK